ncbi:UvrB/UvrC protein [Acidisarcina polymorpha]|uniref:UvrB/UvrC protein n=1 Tax=Acidisarcina polymorpha TaxID=2211140 RepID=A0A2Z5G4Q7_9BACT|nr:UvrB/UvrC motif-containing protein [Acidisarcina polymorpha]AXC14132.1 UvrB/UvrC protein [Acidisarcina polymorpha]
MLAQTLTFDSSNPAPTLALLPEKPGIFALFGADPKAEPYLARTTNLRRRLKRFLDAKPTQTRRLRLTERVVRIEYTATGSDFESSLALYRATLQAFGERARKRLHLYAPYFLRMTSKNRYPRVYVTNSISRSAAGSLFGPFPSRAAAERFCDEALNLFLLRRCYPDLDPDPAFPGCVYSEMKMCLAPCFKGCTDERYGEEAAKVHAFLTSRGQSLLDALAKERDLASQDLDFEKAAAIHARIQKIEATAALASDAVHPLARLGAIIVQPSSEPGHVALFQLSAGILAGPTLYDTFGMRLHNEQSGSSSLYTHPFALEAVPLQEEGSPSAIATTVSPTKLKDRGKDVLEQRLSESFDALRSAAAGVKGENQTLSDHLSLFTRWYYRPEAKRVGEAVFYDPETAPPAKPILRAISRVFRGTLAAVAPNTTSPASSSN